MEITVAEILQSGLLKNAKVIAGKAGLYKPVASVTVGEVPDIAEWLKGGEVVLSTLYAVSEDPAAQLEFVKKIIARDAAALFLKPGRFVGNLKNDLIKEAENVGFPLVEVPTNVRWTDLVRDIYDRMIKTEVEIRMKGDLIDDLLAGQFNAAEIVRRAGFLGADLTRGSLAMVIDIDGFGAVIEKMKPDEAGIQRLKRELLNAATWSVRTFSRKSLISLKSDTVIVFLTPPEGISAEAMVGDAKRLAAEIKNVFAARYDGITISVGLGRFYDEPEALAKTFDEAKTALTIGRMLESANAVTMFDEIGVYKLLLRVYEHSPDELKRLYAETIKPLAEYDAAHKGDLTHTLERYLANDTNLNKTSEELFTHRHTVRYRLERVTEITGLSVDKTDDLEKLGLGLKAGRLLDGLSGTTQ